MIRWAILTGEYPPQPGGVSDYTQLVARGLVESGDSVSVVAPKFAGAADADDHGVRVHRLPDHFGPRGIGALDSLLARLKPDRIVLQYVPQAFGWKGMNLPFAVWVAVRATRFAPLQVMFHEVATPWRGAFRHRVVAVVTRIMARLVADAADRVFVSIPAWGDMLRRIAPCAERAEWLPVPCVVPCHADPEAVSAVRASHASGQSALIGHFGTFGSHIAGVLEPVAVAVLGQNPGAKLLLIGRGSVEFRQRFAVQHPEFAARTQATGELAAQDLPAHLRACDLLIQPYLDGVSSRRTSVMAGLANGVAVVTNRGTLSEPIWSQKVGLAITDTPAEMPGEVSRLLADADARTTTANAGFTTYSDHFSSKHLMVRLRGERT